MNNEVLAGVVRSMRSMRAWAAAIRGRIARGSAETDRRRAEVDEAESEAPAESEVCGAVRSDPLTGKDTWCMLPPGHADLHDDGAWRWRRETCREVWEAKRRDRESRLATERDAREKAERARMAPSPDSTLAGAPYESGRVPTGSPCIWCGGEMSLGAWVTMCDGGERLFAGCRAHRHWVPGEPMDLPIGRRCS